MLAKKTRNDCSPFKSRLLEYALRRYNMQNPDNIKKIFFEPKECSDHGGGSDDDKDDKD